MKIQPVFIIAEAGVNHNGSLQLAKKLIACAAKAGADAVKFQTFKTDEVVTRSVPKAAYQKLSTGAKESQRDMIKKFELNEKQHRELIRYTKKFRIQFLSAPFDESSVDLLIKNLKLKRIKVPSGEIINLPMLLKIAQSKLPIILSTGMSDLKEVEEALGVIAFGYTKPKSAKPSRVLFRRALASKSGRAALKSKVILLQCTTAYPTPFNEVNLRVMETLRDSFDLQVGLSDHTLGVAVPVAAVSRGAVMIEKHLTLSKNLPGPDHKASLEPHEFSQMVASIRQIEVALGSPDKVPTRSEIKNRSVARKSLVAARDISAGKIIEPHDLKAKRAGKGISPVFYWDLIGTKATRNFKADETVNLPEKRK